MQMRRAAAGVSAWGRFCDFETYDAGMRVLRSVFIGIVFSGCFANCMLLGSADQNVSIRRLDGTTISVAEAEDFAKKTLAEAHVTGAQIAVVESGKLVWSGAFGLRRREPELPMDRQTTTWAASITKGVFATYVMQLVERGEFQLDVPVVKQLPQPLDHYDAYKETATELVLDPAWPTVTPRMLLSHSSAWRTSRLSNRIRRCIFTSNREPSFSIREKGSTLCSSSLSRRRDDHSIS
jgi:CubicO group peptidase (beta-lactamase class C family)